MLTCLLLRPFHVSGSSSSSSLSGAVAPAPQGDSVFTSVLNGVVTSGGVARPPAQVHQTQTALKQPQQRKRNSAHVQEEAKDGGVGSGPADYAQPPTTGFTHTALASSVSSTNLSGSHPRILSAHHRPLHGSASSTVDSPSSSSSLSKRARTGHANLVTPSQVVADSMAKVMHLCSPNAVPLDNMQDASSLNNTASTAQLSLNSTSSSVAAQGAFCSLNVPTEASDEEGDDLSSGDESDDQGRVRRSRQHQSRVTPAPQAATSNSAAAGAVAHASSSSSKAIDQDHMGEDAIDEFDEDEGEEPMDLARGALLATQARALQEIAEEEQRDRDLEEEAAAEAADQASEAEAHAFEIQVTAPPAPATSASAAVPVPSPEEFACEESLEDDVTVGRSSPAMVAALGAQPKVQAASASSLQLVHLSAASSAAYINSRRFSLPPSIYRSYHSKDPLIASIESALDEIDPDFEMHMWVSEQTYAPYPFYINFQQELDSNMRPVLVSWMMEVAAEYCLGRETIHLAINYLDRFLAASPWDAPADGPQSRIDRQTLQLLGVTALFIAAKIEEIHPPSAEDMAETTADACTVAGIFNMERTILSVLGWRLHAQTPYAFLKLFLKKTARLVFKEFEEKARHLFVQAQRAQASQTQAEWNAAQAEAAATAAAATAGVSGAAAAAGSAVLHAAAATASSQAALTIHASHSHFSLLQLSFLQDMESLLSQALFVRMMELLDVIALDMHSLRFYPSHLAAAALYIFFPADSSMHAHIFGATGYAAEDLEPALRILRLFLNMEPVGLPNEHARTLMLNLAIPYDELFMRQVHNPAALALVQTHGAEFTDGGVAHVHTNVFRNIPAFLPPSIYAEMHAQLFVVPIRNHHCHRSDPSMWQLNPYANHLEPDCDPVTAAMQAQQALESVYERLRAAAPGEAASAEMLAEAEAALAYRNAMLAQLQNVEAAQAAAAAGGVSSSFSAAAASGVASGVYDAPPPIKPQSESFMAAAMKPYTRLPPHAVHAGNANQAARAAKKAAAAAASSSSSSSAAAAPSRVTVTTSSSAALAAAAAAASSSATAVYTFGALASVAAAAPAPIHASHVAAAAAASSSSRSRPPAAPAAAPLRDEWEDSDDERMDGGH